jgi:ABC-2 type transport system ATP-binding protein
MSSTNDKAVVVQQVSKSYGSFQAVRDVSFDVNRGEIFALLGPNGAGKSTTIRMILDIIRPDSGRIEVLGSPMNDHTKDRIGYLPEERGLYKSAQVLEMMTYLGRLKGLSSAEASKRAMRMLEHLALADVAKKKVSELSKGMQQKVQFGVTVMHDPELIIIDEPFSGLDPVNRLVIRDLLFDFRHRGGAIIMSTHQMNQVEEMADRMTMINRGQQKLYGKVNEIKEKYAVHAIIVQGTGNWAALGGVARVEPAPNQRDAHLLTLRDNVTTDAVLAEIAQSDAFEINVFERAVPSLDEIFIRVAGEESA